MAKVIDLAVTPVTLCTLTSIFRYRYLTVNQVATICGLRPKSASELLLRLERQKLLASFGNVGIRGYGKTPKVYFITKRGHGVLAEECDAAGREAPPFRQINVTSRWSPLMYHRIATLDVLSYVERDCGSLQDYELLGTLVEYRRQKIGKRFRRETTDYVANTTDPADKIIPDAGFALSHRQSGKRALFLIEVDYGTMRLDTAIEDEDVATYTAKLAQYDRYLASGRITDRHPQLGQFKGFHLLTVTTSAARIANMRAAARSLSPLFHKFFRFCTFDQVRQSILHEDWLSRDHADHNTYRLIRGH
ncbi:MAG: replication-relaxation family protein [Pseudomonadota bacterium]